jgi:hypothetical protein
MARARPPVLIETQLRGARDFEQGQHRRPRMSRRRWVELLRDVYGPVAIGRHVDEVNAFLGNVDPLVAGELTELVR